MTDTDQSAMLPRKFKPSMQATFLPRCPACGHKHPLAYNPPLQQSICPGCGGKAGEPGEPITVAATMPDGGVRFGAWLMRIGAYLINVSKRV